MPLELPFPFFKILLVALLVELMLALKRDREVDVEEAGGAECIGLEEEALWISACSLVMDIPRDVDASMGATATDE